MKAQMLPTYTLKPLTAFSTSPDIARHLITIGFLELVSIGIEAAQVPEQSRQLNNLGVTDIVPDLKEGEVGKQVTLAFDVCLQAASYTPAG